MNVLKLYSDGNFFYKAKASGFGGYLQDLEGNVILEYTEQIKQPEYIYSFELLGIIRGLELAKTCGAESVISHCDDKNTAEKLIEIFEEGIFNVPVAMKPDLYKKIIELSKEFKAIKFEYIPRDLNKHADSLSRRYTSLMEKNFTRQYEKDIKTSIINLANNNISGKRIFFAHEKMITNINKTNPFLVAQYRNSKVRKLAKREVELNYNYVFTEIYREDNKIKFKTTLYNENKEITSEVNNVYKSKEKTILRDYVNHVNNILNNIDGGNIWLYSNFRKINDLFEQKKKIDNDDLNIFQQISKKFNDFDRVFFNNFPFEIKYLQDRKTEERKLKIEKEENKLEELMEIIGNNKESLSVTGKNKFIGEIIRCQIREAQKDLERELEEVEIKTIVETVKKTYGIKRI